MSNRWCTGRTLTATFSEFNHFNLILITTVEYCNDALWSEVQILNHWNESEKYYLKVHSFLGDGGAMVAARNTPLVSTLVGSNHSKIMTRFTRSPSLCHIEGWRLAFSLGFFNTFSGLVHLVINHALMNLQELLGRSSACVAACWPLHIRYAVPRCAKGRGPEGVEQGEGVGGVHAGSVILRRLKWVWIKAQDKIRDHAAPGW